MPTGSLCLDCGAEIPPGAPQGLCTRCLFLLGLTETEAGGEDGRAVPEADDGPARRLGEYELIEEIARGGMGVVYRARQRGLGRDVAVKVILAGRFASREMALRFRAEAEAAAQLRHPHIVAIHQTGEHEGQPFFSMDYVPGGNLATLVRGGPLPPRRAVELVRAIAGAVHYAHERGILHRDLKPSNILLDEDGRPVITDFGLARRVEKDSFLTVTGQVLGSPNFMPPEQAGAKLKAGRHSDVYALGGILFYLLTGRPPFLAETVPETLQQVLQHEPVSPRLLNPAVPRDLETICLKCLEKVPGRRYASAQELEEELGRVLAGEPIQARAIGLAERAWRWCRRRPAPALALALLLGVAVGAPLAAVHLAQLRRAAEENLYVTNLRLGMHAMDEHNFPVVLDQLERIEASPHQRAARGWEWRHLSGRIRGQHFGRLAAGGAQVEALAFSPDDAVLAVLTADGALTLWDWEAGRPVADWPAHAPVSGGSFTTSCSLVFARDGRRLFSGGPDGLVRAWDSTSHAGLWAVPAGPGPQATESPPGSVGAVTALALSPDGTRLAGGTLNGWIRLWQVDRDPPELLGEIRGDWNLQGLVLLPDGQTLAATGHRVIRRWDITDPRQPRELPTLEGGGRLVLSPDGRWLTSLGVNNGVQFWRMPAWEPGSELLSPGALSDDVAFSADSRMLAVNR
ncbi:MAG TPA: serine/threonine-protein kinase, partial [Verrucomicrobiota bacterium]|nr:serine/threonine-protein kinase [Verrucomicrobiota bacterium]